MTPTYLFDDASARAFAPFALSRPAATLRAGAALIHERWSAALGTPIAGLIAAPHLADFHEVESPAVVSDGVIPAGARLINARFAPALDRISATQTLTCDGRVVAITLAAPLDRQRILEPDFSLDNVAASSMDAQPIRGWWLQNTWDVLRHLSDMLRADIPHFADSLEDASQSHATVTGPHEFFVAPGAHVEPMVFVDTTAGPVLIRRGATVAAFSRLVGPCVIGVDSQVLGGKVANCSIGNVCRVHGELSSSVFIGHANKGHDGFVGHSLLGRWSNLGAGTVTSNLKNTYGSVHAWTPGGTQDTGMQFLGSLIGDHAKTAIGTRLNTGTVVGLAANVFVAGLTPKLIPAFAWGGDSDARFELPRCLEIAERVMARRNTILGEKGRAYLTAAFRAQVAGHA